MRMRIYKMFVTMLVIVAGTAFLGAADAAKKSHGLDLAGMDKSVSPGDDFFAFANGAWVKSTPIPADRSNYGVFAKLAEEANKRTVGLIQDAAKSKASEASEAR
ncbi:MAG TPA: M13 family peptidase, partial [Thermoanaerobaculia bacterium]|nr:M13 family peptidase [Thermoanaerobaculia bacterium]